MRRASLGPAWWCCCRAPGGRRGAAAGAPIGSGCGRRHRRLMGKGDRGRLSPSGRGQRPRRLRYRLLPAAMAPVPAQGVGLGHRPSQPHPHPRGRHTPREMAAGPAHARHVGQLGIRPPVVVADAAYGTNAGLGAALADRDLAYVLAVRADVVAHPFRREARRSGPQQPPRQSPPPTANGTGNVPQTAHPPLPSSTWTTGANPRRKRSTTHARGAVRHARPDQTITTRRTPAAKTVRQASADRRYRSRTPTGI
jgi:hypothetical protein